MAFLPLSGFAQTVTQLRHDKMREKGLPLLQQNECQGVSHGRIVLCVLEQMNGPSLGYTELRQPSSIGTLAPSLGRRRPRSAAPPRPQNKEPYLDVNSYLAAAG